MIAVDTNVLVHAHRRDSAWHEVARGRMAELGAGPAAWAIPWPCIHEFLCVATHPRVFSPPSTRDEGLEQLRAWRESPHLLLLSESDGYEEVLRRTVRVGAVAGPRIHDARVAALCLHHGVRELWTADRDFSRFPELRVRNPLVGAAP